MKIADLTKEQLEAARLETLRLLCLEDHLFFTRHFFKLREGIKFRVNWHHKRMAAEYERPSVMFRPKLSIDGNQWCALYGDDCNLVLLDSETARQKQCGILIGNGAQN